MPTALITGASSGIGTVFARELAARGYNLLVVARRQERLERLAVELTAKYGIEVEVLAIDLTRSEAATEVYRAVTAKNWTIDLLINNAGFGDFGEFAKGDRTKFSNMIQLNISALVDLTYQFLPQMQQRGKGSIINVASIAAFQALPYFSVYAATKAFVLSFSEALWAENQKYGVNILALCPGPTQTEFFEVAKRDDLNDKNIELKSIATPEEVVKDALESLNAGVSNVVTGGLPNKLIVNLSRFLPRESLAKIIAKQFQPK
jgi:short-subunit dehydrogenase